MIDKEAFDKFIKTKKSNSDYFVNLDLDLLDAPINILTGCNGCGKSQTLKRLKNVFETQGVDYVEYSTSKDAQVSTYVNDWNTDSETYKQGMVAAFSSEGERMHQLFCVWVDKQLFPLLHTKSKKVRVIIDEADSGLSIDRIIASLRGIASLIVPTELKLGRDIKFYLTANSYEMIEVLKSKNTKIIWVPTQQEWNPKTYEEFKEPYVYYEKEVWQ